MPDPAQLGPKSGFDRTINLGHVIVLAGALAGVVGSHYVADYRMAALERKAEAIEAKLDRLPALLVDGAVTAQRIKDLERRVEIVERR